MSDYRWRDRPDIVARLVNADKIQTFATQNVLLKPNEACAMIVDGRVGDILTETNLTNMAGGFGRWLGDKMGVTANDRRLLFAMTGPMDYWVPFEGALGDGEIAKGFANLRLRMNLDDVPKLLNYFANNSPLLDRNGVIKIIGDELKGRVVTPCMSSCANASEMRSATFMEKFEMTAEVEMRNLLSNLGFTLLKAFPITNPTDMELVAQHRAKLEAQTAGTQANADAEIAAYSQSEQLTLARIEMETNIAKAHARGKVTVELEADLKALRAQEAHWEAELSRDRGQMELRNEEADSKAKRAMDMFAEVQDRKAQRIANQQDFQAQRMNTQNELQTKMMEMAAEQGALTPEVMAEFLRQQTAQKAVDGSGGQDLSSSVNGGSCCGVALQPGWKACPSCGTPIA
ncbi:MAG: hypothetical protein QGI21_05895 [Candidatus Poseidoniaceae archaeon]|jgi:hypothetical protein|nr:hypothetical protein [Candidatus Poseidoniaceae archaeon]